MRFLLALLLPALSFAGIWPDNFGAFHRVSAKPVEVSDRPLWEEFGFQQAEEAQYASEVEKFKATAYRLQDATDALGVFQWQRPANSQVFKLGKLAVETPDSVFLADGNYVLFFKGYKPAAAEIDALHRTLPGLDQSPLPVLSSYLPATGRTPNSERYLVGPVGLQKFEPGIPLSTAAFHLGTEAQAATFQTPGGTLNLAIFSYPTPQIARERLVDFQRISGAMVKRTGPLLAVVLSPASRDEAEKLLAQIRYEPAITWNERAPTGRDNIGSLVVTAFKLTGIAILFCVVAGLSFGGIRGLFRRTGPTGEAESMISLHLRDR
jgi:hypothetical protein